MKQLIVSTLKANGIVAKVRPDRGNWRVDVQNQKDIQTVKGLFPTVIVVYGFYK